MMLLAAGSTLAAPFQVEVTGKANQPSMILIPGLASSGDVWTSTVARYKDRYQCHVLTLAGFAGVPPAKADTPILPRVVAGLAAYIDERKLKRPVMVGHSLGGEVALALASAHPGLVGELVIVDALPNLGAIFGADYDAAKLRDRVAGQPRAEYEAFVRSGQSLQGMITGDAHLETLKDWSLRSDQATVAKAMYELATMDLTPGLHKIRSRALVLGTWIGLKSFTTREVVEGNFRKQYASLAGHRFAMAENARHFIMYDDPAWFFAQIDAFLTDGVR